MAAGAALAACQSSPIHEDLEAARAAYERGRNDPLVVRNAWDDLEEARRTLASADETWADRRDERETRRLSVLATRQADAAVAAAAVADERAPAGLALSALPATALPVPATVLVPVQALLFEPGAARLPPAAWRTVERVVQALQQWPEQRVVLTGHADGAGGRAANRRLSRERAEAFKRALVARGVAAERIVVRAQGERLPVGPNDSATGRAMNRRVDIAFPTVAQR
jgi:outer membrane protein OmpA-like peptidoglycan-associated protein